MRNVQCAAKPPEITFDVGINTNEYLTVKIFFPQVRIERLDVTVLPWTARFNKERFHIHRLKPLLNFLGGKLRTVVAADVVRYATNQEQISKHIYYILCSNSFCHINRKALPGMLIKDVEHFGFTPVLKPLGYKVIAPYVVDIFRLLLVAGIIRATITTSLFAAFLLRSLKIIVLPDTIDTLKVDIPLILFKLYRDLAITESRTLFDMLPDSRKHRSILDRQGQFIPLRTSGLLKRLARLSLGYAQLIAYTFNYFSLLSRAYKFPWATSLKIAMSIAWSDTTLRNLAFSF